MVNLFPRLFCKIAYGSIRRYEVKKGLEYIKNKNPLFLDQIYEKYDAEEILSHIYKIDKNYLDLKESVSGEEILEIASKLEKKLKDKSKKRFKVH